MLNYDCIIVEDEPFAIEVLKDYIDLVPSLRLQHICTDAIRAIEILQQFKIDLIFLDMHLPELKGIDFMKSVMQCPPVIITTAYHQYALPSYEHNVVDYLLKPFDFIRVVKAVNKFFLQKNHAEMVTQRITEKPFLLVSVNKKKMKIFIGDIIYLESMRQYVKIFTASGSITTKLKISQVDGWLGNIGFIRIHRSFIVSRVNITSFTVSYVEIGGRQIPIGRYYKESTLTALKAGQVHNNPGIEALIFV